MRRVCFWEPVVVFGGKQTSPPPPKKKMGRTLEKVGFHEAEKGGEKARGKITIIQ